MDIQVGDLVIRKSHGGDIVFKVTDIFVDDTQQTHCVLKGLHLRLMADSPIDDLEPIEAEHLRNEIVRMENMHNNTLRQVLVRRSREREQIELRRSEATKKFTFFDLPGRVLHLDGDEEYLKMCLKTYNQLNLQAVGRWVEESKQADVIINLLEEIRPDILVFTGHDALIGNGKKDINDINNYRNSKHFVAAVKKARLVEPSRDELVIFAGACQSHFEAILSAGANFASSPNRIFIHAYDPVFIAEKVAFTPINRIVDVSDAITASVTGVDGVGGLETRGKFRLGMPKTPIK
ncbi:Sporulation-specific protease YabG [Sporomusa ovata DSM 2662]|uniref:Sporulation-specific protease YabG n=1 Tax=Sporomusa ovata TaxID=2378 RepID=A0A0U1KZI0_9FIRM|nr:sporulation peptidase YabG [Sporomusa ovata]EQB27886.1 sporulation-specific protease YabG [Sporomusa ovata DSM 2662]CQR72821.1 Sporulation-specific protease YabG [Sporomusa ovata]